jgi:hypothetical protein
VTAALAAPPGASAQEGLTVDPDSPAGKEYVIPLDQARRDAVGDRSSVPVGRSSVPSSGEPPLFGVGVGRQKAKRDRPGQAGGPKPGAREPAREREQAGISLASAEPDTPPVGLFTTGLVILGLVLGFALRRAGRVRRDP